MNAGHTLVVAAVIRRGHEILLHQRPAGGWGAGRWEFPGGKVEPGEQPREALIRECREELGVEVELAAPIDLIAHSYPDGKSVTLAFFEARLVDETVEPQPLDGGALEWSSGPALLAYDWLEADWPIVERLATQGRYL